MKKINYRYIGILLCDHPMHLTNIGIGITEICVQQDH